MDRISTLFTALSPRAWRRLGAAFGLFILPVILFVQLADEVRDKDTLAFDESVLRFVNSFASPLLDMLMVGVTQLGGVIGVAAFSVGAAFLLFRRSKKRSALLVLTTVAGSGLINLILKALFQRDRPMLWERLVTENSFSFPSGHAMASSALALSLIVVFWNTKWRLWVVMAGGTYVLLIALTRLYLGVHYPTDIIAGWIVSGLWVAIVALIIKYRKKLFSF